MMAEASAGPPRPGVDPSFSFPAFYSFPPYFTLQPVKETRERQLSLWSQLILAFCRHHKVYVINVQDEFPLFHNPSINRRLPNEAVAALLDDMAAQGNVEWVDKGKRQCIVLWKKIPEWADIIYNFVKTYGLGDSVMVVEELSSGDDVRGTELYGLHREVLNRALRLLESQGKARLFKGASPEEEGVKFV